VLFPLPFPLFHMIGLSDVSPSGVDFVRSPVRVTAVTAAEMGWYSNGFARKRVALKRNTDWLMPQSFAGKENSHECWDYDTAH
jgi:hypothetical protein